MGEKIRCRNGLRVPMMPKFFDVKEKYAEMVKQLYDLGFDDAQTGKDSKTAEEIKEFAKHAPTQTRPLLEAAVCRAYVWGWEESREGKERRDLSAIKASVFKGARI